MKTYFKHYYLLLLLATVLFACSDSDNPAPIIDPNPVEVISHAQLIGEYTVVDAQSGASVGDVWKITQEYILIGATTEAYLYSKNALVTLTTTYTVSKKEDKYTFKYRKNGKDYVVTFEKKESSDIVELSGIIGTHKVVDAKIDNVKNEALIGDIWEIGESSVRMSCGASANFTYVPNTMTIGSVKYTMSKSDKQLIVFYTEGSKAVVLTLETTTEKCDEIIELKDIIGTHKVVDAKIDNVKNEALIGDIWEIGESSVRMSCGASANFTYVPNTMTIGAVKYEVSKVDKALIIDYKEGGKTYQLALETTTEKCSEVLEHKDIIGNFKVASSTSAAHAVGDFVTITQNNIQMGCNTTSAAYAFDAQNVTMTIGTAVYKLNKLANTLNLKFTEAGKIVTISLDPTTEYCTLKRDAVIALMKKVTDWQMSVYNYPAQGSREGGMLDFTSGTLFIGMHEWAKMSTDSKYATWLKDEIGNKRTKWKISTSLSGGYGVFHADDLAIAQFYLASHLKYNTAAMLTDTKKRLDAIMTQGPDETMIARNKQSWTWCDALFMAPPAYAQMAKITGEVKYLDFMKRQFKLSTDHLYDKQEKLYYRDSNYFNKVEANGKKVFWGRGNGWVVAGIANMLKYLPADYSERPYYEALLVEMIDKLLLCQDEQGFWHASLLDMETYKSPETSASTLIAYAIAYGINNGLLEKDKYMPQLIKAWNAIETAVHPNGKLGWVQPIGQDPKEVTFDMTAVYGVGGFLLAGTEIAKILEK